MNINMLLICQGTNAYCFISIYTYKVIVKDSCMPHLGNLEGIKMELDKNCIPFFKLNNDNKNKMKQL